MAVAFFVWYPLQDTKTATADIGDLPDPTTFLYGSDLNSFNSLEQHAREDLMAEAVPQLISVIFDVGEEPTEDDVKYLTTIMVRLFKQVHDGIEAQKLILQTQASDLTQDNDATSACDYGTSLFSYNNKVSGAHHAQCEDLMASSGAGVWLTGPGGYDSGLSHYIRHHKRSASLSEAEDLQSGCWNGWGAGGATPENDGPNPSPGAGDDQLERCYD